MDILRGQPPNLASLHPSNPHVHYSNISSIKDVTAKNMEQVPNLPAERKAENNSKVIDAVEEENPNVTIISPDHTSKSYEAIETQFNQQDDTNEDETYDHDYDDIALSDHENQGNVG